MSAKTAACCGLALLAMGLAGPVRTGWAESPMGALQEASGKVMAVDPQMRTVALKMGLFASAHFVVGADTMILEGNRKLRLGDLKAGDPVEVRFYTRDGRNIAQTIAVRSKRTGEERG